MARHIVRTRGSAGSDGCAAAAGANVLGRRCDPVQAPVETSRTRSRTEHMSDRYDALIIGGGPSGAAAAYWLAERGRRVLVVEKKRFPREKTCGDGLTPRAVRQLHDMGLAEPLAEFQRFGGLRS